jgi:hypothetical protein
VLLVVSLLCFVAQCRTHPIQQQTHAPIEPFVTSGRQEILQFIPAQVRI